MAPGPRTSASHSCLTLWTFWMDPVSCAVTVPAPASRLCALEMSSLPPLCRSASSSGKSALQPQLAACRLAAQAAQFAHGLRPFSLGWFSRVEIVAPTSSSSLTPLREVGPTSQTLRNVHPAPLPRVRQVTGGGGGVSRRSSQQPLPLLEEAAPGLSSDPASVSPRPPRPAPGQTAPPRRPLSAGLPA